MLSRSWCASRSLGTRTLMSMARVVEVGPRDGLQNVSKVLNSSVKIDLVNRLAETGLRSIEIASIVSPKKVPQMADVAEVIRGVKSHPSVEYSVLVPNVKGIERAVELGVKEVLLTTSASEGFARANLNCSIAEAQQRICEIATICKENKIKMRGSISCTVGCPFDGQVDPTCVAEIAKQLFDYGCYEVSLADTIGVGTPRSFAKLFKALRVATGGEIWRCAMHCHDTYGQALVNIYEGLYQGVRVFDSSVAGLGGCPFAPGATGNVATEDLVYLLHGEGMVTGIDLDKVIKVGQKISSTLCVPNNSKVGQAVLAKESNACKAKTSC